MAGVSERALQHGGGGLGSLLLAAGDDYALAGGEAIGLNHDRAR